MDNSAISDINTTVTTKVTTIHKNNSTFDNNREKNKIFKQIWQLGSKHLVIVDESIIQKLGITDEKTFFVEQEVLEDNQTILMRISKI